MAHYSDFIYIHKRNMFSFENNPVLFIFSLWSSRNLYSREPGNPLPRWIRDWSTCSSLWEDEGWQMYWTWLLSRMLYWCRDKRYCLVYWSTELHTYRLEERTPMDGGWLSCRSPCIPGSCSRVLKAITIICRKHYGDVSDNLGFFYNWSFLGSKQML